MCGHLWRNKINAFTLNYCNVQFEQLVLSPHDFKSGLEGVTTTTVYESIFDVRLTLTLPNLLPTAECYFWDFSQYSTSVFTDHLLYFYLSHNFLLLAFCQNIFLQISFFYKVLVLKLVFGACVTYAMLTLRLLSMFFCFPSLIRNSLHPSATRLL